MTQLLCKLKKYDQIHVVDYYDDLSENERTNLLKQIESIDFLKISKRNENEKNNSEIFPINVLSIEKINKEKNKYERIGLDILKSGRVGLVLLAGGQGSRLGFNKPKGMFDIGIKKELTLFQIILNNTMEIVKRIGKWIYIFIMTSPENDDQIKQFFKEKNYFNYSKNHIKFYRQNSLPSTDLEGKLLMKGKGEICFSPDGNGNFYNALKASSIYETIKKNKIEWLNVFSIDNVLQKVADPVFIGATINSNCNCGAKVVKKLYADEKMGIICLKDKLPTVIEYYELPKKYDATLKDNNSFIYGVTLNYLFKVEELEKIRTNMLPIHYAKKSIPCIDKKCNNLSTKLIDGYKLEYLITDIIQLTRTCVPFEVVRDKEFAPIKNKNGVDSVESARGLLLANGYDL